MRRVIVDEVANSADHRQVGEGQRDCEREQGGDDECEDARPEPVRRLLVRHLGRDAGDHDGAARFAQARFAVDPSHSVGAVRHEHRARRRGPDDADDVGVVDLLTDEIAGIGCLEQHGIGRVDERDVRVVRGAGAVEERVQPSQRDLCRHDELRAGRVLDLDRDRQRMRRRSRRAVLQTHESARVDGGPEPLRRFGVDRLRCRSRAADDGPVGAVDDEVVVRRGLTGQRGQRGVALREHAIVGRYRSDGAEQRPGVAEQRVVLVGHRAGERGRLLRAVVACLVARRSGRSRTR